MVAFELKACLTYQPNVSATIVSYSEEAAAEEHISDNNVDFLLFEM